jgi:hypothetical protein
LTESRANARLTESDGAGTEAANWWAEAAAEASNLRESTTEGAKVVEAAAETTQVRKSAVQQESERPRLSARPR